MPGDLGAADDRGLYNGWIAGAVAIVVIFVIGAGLWFTYHP